MTLESKLKFNNFPKDVIDLTSKLRWSMLYLKSLQPSLKRRMSAISRYIYLDLKCNWRIEAG